MRRTAKLISGAAAFVLLLSGCGGIRYPDLPENAQAFELGEFIDTSDDDAAYGTIDFEGRTYLPYGMIDKALQTADIAECVGYMVQDGQPDKDERFFTLTADSEHNYLLQYNTVSTLMNMPLFWRAADTKGKEINMPDYMASLDYKIWENDVSIEVPQSSEEK